MPFRCRVIDRAVALHGESLTRSMSDGDNTLCFFGCIGVPAGARHVAWGPEIQVSKVHSPVLMCFKLSHGTSLVSASG